MTMKRFELVFSLILNLWSGASGAWKVGSTQRPVIRCPQPLRARIARWSASKTELRLTSTASVCMIALSKGQ